MNKCYKFLSGNGYGYYSNTPWLLPDGDGPGPWMPKIENIKMCRSGYHVCTDNNLMDWADEALWEVELRGKISIGKNKIVAQEARLLRRVSEWNDRTLRLCAVAGVLNILPIFEKNNPGDMRPRRALEAAICFANGEITREELRKISGEAFTLRGAYYASSIHDEMFILLGTSTRYCAYYMKDCFKSTDAYNNVIIDQVNRLKRVVLC